MRFASKAQLLEQIQVEHDRFLDLLASIPLSRRREAGVWGDGWTIQDLVAHLAEWHVMFLRWYRDGQFGPSPAMPAPGYKWSQLQELNRAIWLKHRREPGSQIMRDFARSYRQILTLAQGLSPGELLEPGRFAWTGRYPLTTYLAPNTSSHYRFATKVLKRWLRADASARTGRSSSRSR